MVNVTSIVVCEYAENGGASEAGWLLAFTPATPTVPAIQVAAPALRLATHPDQDRLCVRPESPEPSASPNVSTNKVSPIRTEEPFDPYGPAGVVAFSLLSRSSGAYVFGSLTNN